MPKLIFSACFPVALSMALIKRDSSIGWLLPMLNKVYGISVAGITSCMRTMPSTMSSMYVKSRCILPWLNTLIGWLFRMASVNNHGAMSGRPAGPYTVKMRRPVVGMLYSLEYAWAISSLAFLVAAYRATGWSTLSVSLNGILSFIPYTELDDA